MDIKFKPITEGLGFHPFSDGLPYAPVAKGKGDSAPPRPERIEQPRIEQPRIDTRGTGAISAGRPQFAKVLPPISAPKAQAVPAPAPAQPTTLYGLPYVLKRVIAYLLDTVLNLAVCVTGLSVVLVRYDVAPELLASPGVLMASCLFLAFFNWAMITAQEVAFGASIGKRLLGLQLQGSASAAFLRAFFFVPSVAFMGAGLLWALFDRRRRCWHDIIVDLQPEEVATIR